MQQPESSEVSHDISNGIHRNESAPPKAEEPDSSGGSSGCVIGSSKKPLGNPIRLVLTWSREFQAGDKTYVETTKCDITQIRYQ